MTKGQNICPPMTATVSQTQAQMRDRRVESVHPHPEAYRFQKCILSLKNCQMTNLISENYLILLKRLVESSLSRESPSKKDQNNYSVSN